MARSAHQAKELGLDPYLAHEADGFSDQIKLLARLKGGDNSDRSAPANTPNAALSGWNLGPTLKPTTSRGTAQSGWPSSLKPLTAGADTFRRRAECIARSEGSTRVGRARAAGLLSSSICGR
jgi:hypothetical protein